MKYSGLLGGIGLAVAGLLFAGCGNVCDQGEKMAENCGFDFDRADCEQDLEVCTGDDLDMISAYYSCIEDVGECSDGEMGYEGAIFDCLDELDGMSDECLGI